jgi:iron complex outermembrane receptor protein
MNGTSNFRARLAGGVALLALGTSPALAQGDTTNVEQVVVSGSRISISGYSQPTPVTVVDMATLERDASVNVGDEIRQLPALGASGSPNNNTGNTNIATANAGSDLVNLRNLGFLRTLVLVDGQRVVASNITGGVDMSTIPTSVLQRVDVVTGGGSAAYGSDAISGVVNLILNKNFTGLKANAEAGISTYGDHAQWKGELTYGTAFDGDRGHVVLSGSYVASPDMIFPVARQWFNNNELVLNPAYTATNAAPHYILGRVGYAKATQGGVILSGAAANTQFLANGTPAAFNPGITSDSYCASCDGDPSAGSFRNMITPYHNTTLFGYGSYKITDDIKATLQLNYGVIRSQNSAAAYTRLGVLTMSVDNPYLDPTLAAKIRAAGQTTFTFGTTNVNNININNLSFADLTTSVGIPTNINNRQLYRGVFGLEGTLGDDWSWNASWQHSTSRIHLTITHNQIVSNYANAINAVRVTAAQAATSGFAAGSIQCGVLVTGTAAQKAAAAGCQPLNIFGTNVASQAAINYVNVNNQNFEEQILNQDEAMVSLQGKLPWGLPAGRIAVALGGNHRREVVRVSTDPGAVAGIYNVGNFKAQFGAYNVDEGFAEADVPVLRDNLVQSLDFNAAGRITNYSTSGLVETWKLGGTSQVDDNIKLRTSWSLDIRAPTLNDLYAAGAQTSFVGNDDRTGAPLNGAFQVAIGNPNLKPEVSTTVSGGVVLTPQFVPGLSLSLDWYSIVIKNAIFTTPAATELAQCKANQASPFCAQLVRNGPGGTVSQIIVSPLNAASATTSGLDFQADYTMPVYDGDLDLKILGNYMDEQTQTTQGVTTDYAGALSDDSLVTGGVPKFKMTALATYDWGPWSGTVQGRLIGSAKLNNAWTAKDVYNNAVPAVAYMDLRASYAFDDNIKFYGAIDNLWNAPPPSVPDTSTINANQPLATRGDIYDIVGRMFRIGLRFSQ